MANKQRATELDFLRGMAMLMMLFFHFSWDIRYEFGKNACGYMTSNWFNIFFHPLILVLFIGVSGICCTFSRDNFKRGLRLIGVAMAFTIGSFVVQLVTGIESLILFNVLHLLSVGILAYALIEKIEAKCKIKPELTNTIMGLVGAYIMIVGRLIKQMDHCTDNMIFLPIGFSIKGMPTMADYLPIFPWLGIFFVGVAVGRMSYSDRQTKLPEVSATMKKIASPVEALGRHSLIFYIVHQPIVYGILWLIFKVSGN